MQDFIHTPPGNSPVAIYEDGGGLVELYQTKAIQYSMENRRVEIRGSCRSACILALSVPTVCATPGAVVKAHYAYEKDTKKVRLDVTNDMLNTLPRNISTVIEKNIQKNYTEGATLNYSELRELGVPACSSKEPQVRKNDRSEGEPYNKLLKLFERY